MDLLDLGSAVCVSNLQKSYECNNLEDAEGGHGLKSGESVLYATEGGSVGDVSWKTDTSGGGDVSENGHHGNTAVLGLDGSVKVELLLVGILKKAKGIEEAKGSLSTDGVLYMEQCKICNKIS